MQATINRLMIDGSGDLSMKRFVDLGRQLWVDEEDLEMPRQFAWYDTTIDKFETFVDQQVWESWADFEKDALDSIKEDGRYNLDIERYRRLCPSWVFGNTPQPRL